MVEVGSVRVKCLTHKAREVFFTKDFDKWEALLKREETIYRDFFRRLMVGEVDAIESIDGRNRAVFTMSSKKSGTVQKTVFGLFQNGWEPLSDSEYATPIEMAKDVHSSGIYHLYRIDKAPN